MKPAIFCCSCGENSLGVIGPNLIDLWDASVENFSIIVKGRHHLRHIQHIVFDCDGTLLDTQLGLTPYAGIPELLYQLRQEEFLLSIWTARDQVSCEGLLQQYGLLRLFQNIRSSTNAPLKPNPQALREICGPLSPQQCVMIGDSWADMRGAKLFGSKAIGALWNIQAKREVLKEFGADTLVSTPQECYTAILKFM